MNQSHAIRIENLNKRFGWRKSKRVQAVKDLSLEVPAGMVYGFLGPNGAGKTTTIRMILDLIRPNQGDVYLFGKHVRREREVLGRVGSLVEGAQFYNFLTGRRNLEILALNSNLDVPAKTLNYLLDLVGMLERSKRRVKGYSTGMKQRLGLAAALLGDPDLVILDEPTNGLDPHGIHEMRNFIRELADEQGKTVFLSSHQLSEVEQICDRVAIINKGQLVKEGSVNDLVASRTQYRIEAEPLSKAHTIISEHWETTQNGTHLLVNANREDVPQLVNKLVENDIKLFDVHAQRQSLEDYFLAVTKGENSHVD